MTISFANRLTNRLGFPVAISAWDTVYCVNIIDRYIGAHFFKNIQTKFSCRSCGFIY